jgi:hypothetical protein
MNDNGNTLPRPSEGEPTPEVSVSDSLEPRNPALACAVDVPVSLKVQDLNIYRSITMERDVTLSMAPSNQGAKPSKLNIRCSRLEILDTPA